jgi:DNA-directed RNA polymerase specialized sigma24 family protein
MSRVYPAVEHHARKALRYLGSEREEAVQEAVAVAWKLYCAAIARGKDGATYPGSIAKFAVRRVKCGRGLAHRESPHDVLSRRARCQAGFTVSPLPAGSAETGNALDEALHDDRTPIPDQAAFALDFPRWLGTLTPRQSKAVEYLAQSYSTEETARAIGVTPSAVSHMRRTCACSYRSFCGE